MKSGFSSFLGFLSPLVAMAGCGQQIPLTGEGVYSALRRQGMTCEVQNAAEGLSKAEWGVLQQLVASQFTLEEFGEVVSRRDLGCDTEAVDFTSQALAGVNDSHNVEFIEVDGNPNSAVSGTGIDADDSSTGYMCGYDPGSSLDLIWEFDDIPYSHYYRQYLRYEGIGGFGNCVQLFTGTVAARVYTDDSIRMCVGGATADWCLGFGSMSNGSFVIGFQP